MRKVFLLITCLILHGSLYPYDFYARPIADGLIDAGLEEWPEASRWLVRDMVVNVLLYIPFGGVAYLSFRERRGMAGSVALAAIAGLLLSTTVEFAQLFDRGRTSSMADICYNVVGTVAGIWMGAAVPSRTQRRLSEAHVRLGAPEAAGLLALWVLQQLYPLFPSLSLYTVGMRVRALLLFAWNWTEVLAGFAIWTGIAVLVRAVFGEKARRLFFLLLLAVPFRLFVAGKDPTVSPFLSAALAGMVALVAWRILTPQVATVSLLLSIAVRELLPFDFQPDRVHGFGWVPFGGSLHSEWLAGFAIVLDKSVHYGLTAWSIRASGWGWTAAAITVAGMLAVGEFLQMWLPGRTPEVTDPLLTVLMVVVLRTLQRESEPRLLP